MSQTSPKSLYGLPEEVRFCKKCVISNQRPSSTVEYQNSRSAPKKAIAFDEAGRCDACLAAERKSVVDWDQRRQQLIELSARVANHPGPYNCVVPGSGGKDSFFQAFMLKNEFGFRPLLVTWAPHLFTPWGRRNWERWLNIGVDSVLLTPNPLVHRLLTRLATDNLFHPFQPFILGQKNSGARIASQYDIPLVFYGENESEYGNASSLMSIPTRSSEFHASGEPRNSILGGCTVDELINDIGLSLHDLHAYLPLPPEDVEAIEVHYLGYYLEWHPQEMYYFAVDKGNFEPCPHRVPGTYSRYASLDDKVDDLHYWTTYVKFGIGRATYDAAQEIRNGDLTREEGVKLVHLFDGEWPSRFQEELMTYLSVDSRLGPRVLSFFDEPRMTFPKFMGLSERFRSPHLWRREGSTWVLRHRVA